MTRVKPVHTFQVRIVRHGQPPSSQFCIYGATFFDARARLCEVDDVHPDEVRPVPTGDGCRV